MNEFVGIFFLWFIAPAAVKTAATSANLTPHERMPSLPRCSATPLPSSRSFTMLLFASPRNPSTRSDSTSLFFSLFSLFLSIFSRSNLSFAFCFPILIRKRSTACLLWTRPLRPNVPISRLFVCRLPFTLTAKSSSTSQFQCAFGLDFRAVSLLANARTAATRREDSNLTNLTNKIAVRRLFSFHPFPQIFLINPPSVPVVHKSLRKPVASNVSLLIFYFFYYYHYFLFVC